MGGEGRMNHNSEEARVNVGLKVKGSITVLLYGSEPTRLINHNTVFEVRYL